MGGRESRIFLHCHLEPEPSGIYISLCPKQRPAKSLAYSGLNFQTVTNPQWRYLTYRL